MKLTTIDLLTQTSTFSKTEKSKAKLECKFVLLSSETEHFLIFGALQEYNYHAQLLEKFCVDNNIKSKWRKTPDMFDVEAKEYAIKGGGWFSFDFMNKRVTAMGISTAYGRFDEDVFNLFLTKNLIYKDFRIKISY